MKKILIGILLIFIALWGGMTWVASNKTEEVFDSMLVESNQKITEAVPFLKIEKQSFSQGFISSTAKSIIHIDPEILDLKEPLKITLDHTIYHGPLMLTSDGIKTGTSYIVTTLDQSSLEEKIKEAITLVFAGKHPITSAIQTNFNNSISLSFDIPTLLIDSVDLEKLFENKKNSKDNFNLSLEGISGKFSTDSKTSYLDGLVSLGALNITGTGGQENFTVDMSTSDMEFDMDELYHSAMLQGSVAFNLPKMLISSGEQSVSLKEMVFKSIGGKQEQSYSQTTSIDIEKLLINVDNSSAMLPESKLHISLGLKGLDQVAIKHLLDLGNSMQSSLQKSSGSKQVQQQLNADISTYLQALSDLIKPGLATNHVIELNNEKGMSSIHFDLSYVSAKKLLELKTLQELIMALSAEIRISTDKNMVVGTPVEMLLDSPMASNYVQNNVDTYTAIAILDNGQLSLNGKPIPYIDMLGPSAKEPFDWEKYLQ